MNRIIFCSLSMLLLLPLSSPAAPAITCHCFTDRSYDPSRPAAADPYFLATTQNSFFAALFNVDKKTVVMKKQAGNSAEDLWVAYWVASGSGSSPEALLALRGRKGSWKEVLAQLGLPAQSLGERFAAEVAAGAPSLRLAQAIVDDVLVRYRLIGAEDLAELRREWITNQEVILTSLIAAKSGRPPLRIYREAKRGAKSWGAFLGEAKLQPAGIQAEFAALLKPSRR